MFKPVVDRYFAVQDTGHLSDLVREIKTTCPSLSWSIFDFGTVISMCSLWNEICFIWMSSNLLIRKNPEKPRRNTNKNLEWIRFVEFPYNSKTFANISKVKGSFWVDSLSVDNSFLAPSNAILAQTPFLRRDVLWASGVLRSNDPMVYRNVLLLSS